MNKENLIRMRDFLNGPPIPGFDINSPGNCVISHIQEAIPGVAVTEHYPKFLNWKATARNVFDLCEHKIKLLFGGTHAYLGWDEYQRLRPNKYLGIPDDQYAIAKNIDYLLNGKTN